MSNKNQQKNKSIKKIKRETREQRKIEQSHYPDKINQYRDIIGALHLPRHIYVWLTAGVYIMTAIFLYVYFKTSNLFFGIMSIFLTIGCCGGSLLVLMFYRVKKYENKNS